MLGHIGGTKVAAALFVLWAAAGAGASPASPRGEVLIVVGNVNPGHGPVRVSLCREATWLRPNCAFRGEAPSSGREVRIRLRGVPAGAWAASAYQDSNSNGHADFNVIGLPQEPMGVSRGAVGSFGPPAYRDAVLTLPSAGAVVTVSLRQ